MPVAKNEGLCRPSRGQCQLVSRQHACRHQSIAELCIAEPGDDQPANLQPPPEVRLVPPFPAPDGEKPTYLRPMSELPGLIQEWRSSGGDQVRNDYEDAIASSA